jgi:endonuclease/exonuclease/phosphatase family metal-dependent hydrolase
MSPPSAAVPPGLNRAARCVIGLSCLNLVALCAVSYLIYSVSETWWVGTVLTYAPRTPYLVPTLMLLVASLFWHRPSIGMNLVAAAIVLVPIMGLSLPLANWTAGSSRPEGEIRVKILSCNVQSFKPHFEKVLAEISAIKPDVVALQEAFRGDARLDEFFRDWHTLQHGHYWVGSRYPVTLISDCEVTQFGGRLAGMLVQIELPSGPIVLGDIHQMTARFGLKELNRNTLINGDGTQELENFEGERYLESIDIRAKVETARADRPLIVCGDFNTPSSSSLFQKHWGDLQSSFDIAGIGYGYTSPCKGNRFWPDNLPWARIDHILCSSEWVVRDCQIGTSDGSDHRLIAATIVLRPKADRTETGPVQAARVGVKPVEKRLDGRPAVVTGAHPDAGAN